MTNINIVKILGNNILQSYLNNNKNVNKCCHLKIGFGRQNNNNLWYDDIPWSRGCTIGESFMPTGFYNKIINSKN